MCQQREERQLRGLLIIDDEEAFLELFVEFMKMRHPDVVVHCAKNGNEGIELYKKLVEEGETPHIVAVDYHLEGLGGTDTISKIKEMNESQKLVVLTANITPTQIDDAKRVGAETVIEKPYDFTEIVDHLAKIVQEP